MSNTISKKRERRLGKGASSIGTTVSIASSNKLETRSTTPKSVSDNLDVGILSKQGDNEYDEVFTWIDHDAPTRGRGGRRRAVASAGVDAQRDVNDDGPDMLSPATVGWSDRWVYLGVHG